jgi:Flp pilus assembly protein TadD
MLVDGSLYAVESGGLRLDLRRIDLSTGKVLSSHTISGNDIFTLVDNGTVSLSGEFGVAPPTGSVADVTTRSEVAARLYEEGLHAFYRSDPAGARSLLRAALAEDSMFAMAAYYLARATDRTDEFVGDLERALRLAEHAGDRERLIIRSAWSVWTSHPSAIAILDTLTLHYPQELEGNVYAGKAFSEAGEHARAIERLRHVIVADSLALEGTAVRCIECDARFELMEVYSLMDSLGAAEREARVWTQVAPAMPAPWNRLGHVLARLGRAADARAAWRRAAELDPTLNSAPGFLFYYYAADGDFEAADRELRRIAELSGPDRRAAAYWNLVLSLRRQGRFGEALEAARDYRLTVQAAYPSYTPHDFSFHYAQVLFELGRFRESAALFDSIASAPVGVSPSHRARGRATMLAMGATALAATKDTARFAMRIDTVRLLGSGTSMARVSKLHHYVRGLLLASRGNDEEAVAEFRRALTAPAEVTRINQELARALLRLGRPLDAVHVLQPAVRAPIEYVRLYTNLTELEELLAQAWDAAGARDSALVHYRAVLHAWQHADPILQDRIAAVRARVSELQPDGASRLPTTR